MASNNIYLYLMYDNGSAVFAQIGIDNIDKALLWTKSECVQTVDYINSQRSIYGYIGTVKSYNPYTGEII